MKKQTKKRNIKDFNYEVICEMRKKRSPQVLRFSVEDDPWFIDVFFYKAKSGTIDDHYLITRPELEGRIAYFERYGYEKL